MDMGLKGKNVLVLASSKGLGKASAELYAKAGANVMITSRTEENLKWAAEDIKKHAEGKVTWKCCDVSNPAELESLIESTVQEFGGIDVLVNNAGGPPPGMFEELGDEEWEFAFQQNLMSVVRTVRLVLPYLKESRGKIINITSISMKEPVDGLLLSNVFRMGTAGLAKTLSRELAQYGILVNSIGPGRIATERLVELDGKRAERLNTSPEEVRKETEAGIPLGRYGKPEEFASTVLFLGSSLNTYITGQMFLVDGGMSKAY